jgi:hypothetical protein
MEELLAAKDSLTFVRKHDETAARCRASETSPAPMARKRKPRRAGFSGFSRCHHGEHGGDPKALAGTSNGAPSHPNFDVSRPKGDASQVHNHKPRPSLPTSV